MAIGGPVPRMPIIVIYKVFLGVVDIDLIDKGFVHTKGFHMGLNDRSIGLLRDQKFGVQGLALRTQGRRCKAGMFRIGSQELIMLRQSGRDPFDPDPLHFRRNIVMGSAPTVGTYLWFVLSEGTIRDIPVPNRVWGRAIRKMVGFAVCILDGAVSVIPIIEMMEIPVVGVI